MTRSSGRMSYVGTLVLAALVCPGCGNDRPQPQRPSAPNTKPTIRNADPWTEAQVVKAAGLKVDADGIAYKTKSGCSASVVMTSAASVNLYASAGDTVVTNPDGTAGVKTVGSDRACLLELQRGLATLAKR